MKGLILLAAIGLIACRQAEAPHSSYAFVLFDAESDMQGMETLEELDQALSAEMRSLLQIKSATEQSGTMMIRFGGNCVGNSAFVKQVRAFVEKRGGRNVRCTTDLPGDS